jgi:hypothetical protein
MTEAEARVIVVRFVGLVAAVTYGGPQFEMPLELIDGRLWATQTERQEPQGDWFPRVRWKDVQELPEI